MHTRTVSFWIHRYQHSTNPVPSTMEALVLLKFSWREMEKFTVYHVLAQNSFLLMWTASSSKETKKFRGEKKG